MHAAIAGYSIAFWVNFPSLPNQEHVYLSSGGDLQENHGLAMSLNQYGQLTFTFKTKEGLLRKFISESNLIVPNRWYHVLATFSHGNGVRLYINGLRVGSPTCVLSIDIPSILYIVLFLVVMIVAILRNHLC